jgi:acetyltransferase-like isoleucine patch superfamily enzyme
VILRSAIFLTRRIRWRMGGIWARLVLRSYGVEFGPGMRIGSAPIIRRHQTGTIRLGRNVTILNELAENPAGIAHPTVLCACQAGSELRVGDDVGMSGAILYAWKRIVIGDGVLLGAGAAVYDSDFHPVDPDERRRGADTIGIAPVVIEENVWLGARAMVLKGVTIGRDAVVAAGAVVTKDVPAGSIVAGMPARVVGQAAKVGAKVTV